MVRQASVKLVVSRFLDRRALSGDKDFEAWEKTQRMTAPVISRPLMLRLRRLFRVPGSQDFFHLYERLYAVSQGAPLPEKGFLQAFKQSIRFLKRVLPRVVDASSLDMVVGQLDTAFGTAAPFLRRIDGGGDTPILFQRAAMAFLPAVEGILQAAGTYTDSRIMPGGGRFPGIRIVNEEKMVEQETPEEIKAVFTPDEKALPKKAFQPTTSLDDLYTQAVETMDMQLDLLNRGKGLDAAIGGKVVRGDLKEKADYSEPGPIIAIGPLKGRKRVIEKTQESGEGFDNVLDFVRATIAVDGLDDIPPIVSKLRAMGVEFARQPKNRLDSPTDVLYRDIMFNVKYPNGHVGEIQINLKKMLEAKKIGHKYYETTRAIVAAKKLEGNRVLTEEEEAVMQTANEIQRNLYNEAWKQILGESKGTKMAATPVKVPVSKVTLYYTYNDLPAYVAPRQLPVVINAKSEEVTIYDVEKFFRDSHRISHGMYLNLLANRAPKR